MKETLPSKFTNSISHHLSDGITPEASYKRVKDTIHTEAVSACIASAGPNPVLGFKHPDVHPSKQLLPRAHQTTLHQLQSGKCSSLCSYQPFIKSAVDNICADCHVAPHTTSHLFSCPSNPTTLTLLDLWYKLVEAAEFVIGLPSFDHIPLLDPPLPPPPPESPP
jgi:hypothetical protein